jgi:hypothetical protein
MNQEKYIGMDVHQATISVAVMDSSGKLVMECMLETKAGTILEFIGGLQGSLSVTFEEGTSAAWLHDLLKPHVSHLVVCDPRKNALLKDGSKSDRIDARKLAELLRGNQLKPVYHGEHALRKAYKEREIPIPTKLVSSLKAWKAKADKTCDLVFPTSGCNVKMNFLDDLNAVAERAEQNPEDFWLHKFRATFATRCLWAGVDLRTVQQWLGHSDIESTMRYLKPSRSQQVREKVNEIFA